MSYTAKQAKEMLETLGVEDPNAWMRGVNTLIVDIYEQLDVMRPVLGRHHKFLRPIMADAAKDAAQATPAAAPAAAGDTPMVGADGSPLDPTQAEAEALMNAAAGPRDAVGAATPAAQPAAAAPAARPAPPRGGVRLGVDGAPLDAAAAAAEEAMDAAAGPRS